MENKAQKTEKVCARCGESLYKYYVPDIINGRGAAIPAVECCNRKCAVHAVYNTLS